MSDYSFEESMNDALALYRGISISAEDLVKAAEMIRLYKNKKLIVSIDGYSQRGSLPVNNCDSFGVKSGNISSVSNVRGVGVGVIKTDSQAVNQPLSGVFSSHNNSSSARDGESVGEIATPSRTETVVADGGTVTAIGAHPRTDGGGA